MIIWIVIGMLVAGMAARPSDLSKGQMKAVFRPHMEEELDIPVNMVNVAAQDPPSVWK